MSEAVARRQSLRYRRHLKPAAASYRRRHHHPGSL
ncbi:hypothetical protein QFZ70_000813 [Arthrobacter sp. V1I9]|nr:hypothetical protein [Arthrobacter sp. V1I9]